MSAYWAENGIYFRQKVHPDHGSALLPQNKSVSRYMRQDHARYTDGIPLSNRTLRKII